MKKYLKTFVLTFVITFLVIGGYMTLCYFLWRKDYVDFYVLTGVVGAFSWALCFLIEEILHHHYFVLPEEKACETSDDTKTDIQLKVDVMPYFIHTLGVSSVITAIALLGFSVIGQAPISVQSFMLIFTGSMFFKFDGLLLVKRGMWRSVFGL